MTSIVTMLSDFGLVDSYVAEMKAAILSVDPEVMLVDISHEIRKFDIGMGAFVLASASKSFPEGTVHLAIVDPGVGSERRPIIVKSRRACYVGPDNGLLILAATHDGLESVYQIETGKLPQGTTSPTFHGRDIFAPVAGLLAKGTNPSELGHEISDYLKSNFKAERAGTSLTSEIIHIDDFGNVVIGISAAEMEKEKIGELLKIKIGQSRSLTIRLVRTYSDLGKGSLVALIGSHGFLEIARNGGNAAKALHVHVGDLISIPLY
ncbi:MAG: SAM-dependent chlorinase/fluorinase [archaeon]